MPDKYKPRAGSLAEKVINHFRLNPTRKLTLDEVRFMWPINGNILLKLEEAIAHKLLVVIDRDGTLAAGPALVPLLTPNTIATPPTAVPSTGGLKTGARRGHLPPLDLDALAVQKGVPMPLPTGGRSNRGSRWDSLLAKMSEAGDSIEVPREYNGTLTTYCRKLKKTQPQDTRKFKIGLGFDGVNRIWRVA